MKVPPINKTECIRVLVQKIKACDQFNRDKSSKLQENLIKTRLMTKQTN